MHALIRGLAAAALLLGATSALAQTRVTYKSAGAGTSYYQMGVQIAEALRTSAPDRISVTVEESQGSVQNVMEVAARSGAYVFTSPPGLVAAAQAGTGQFEGKGNPKFDTIRGLFPIPAISMHFVMRADSGVETLDDLAGKTILIGRGTFGANEAARYLTLFGLEGKVTLADVELSNAVPALRNRQIDGFVTASSFPAPNVIEASAGGGVKILSLTEEQVAATGATRLVIPAGTYEGQTADIVTTTLPVIAFGTTEMDDDTAYTMTRTFWEQRTKMAETAPWWNGVTPDLVAAIRGKVHPGAIRYYDEIGVPVRDDQR
jgi:TRAP transporter TAXI family solute receptor